MAKIPAGNCIHEMFEAQARANPDAEALVCGKRRITFRELNFRADRMAETLASLGAGPEVLVGLFMDRCEDMVSGILAILKAGGAYLPLDPAYPSERLSFILRDAKVGLVLTQSSFVQALEKLDPNAALRSIVCCDADPRPQEGGRIRRLPASERNLSYVIYTSGSSGLPKGVAVEHRNAVALIHWAAQVYSQHELDGILASTSICFDPSVLDLLMPLCLGGRVIMVKDALALPILENAGDVRLIFSVPSVIRELMRMGGLPHSLETINMGGEPLPSQLVDQLYDLPNVKRVYDLYGPTETTTCSLFALRDRGEPATIGRPIEGTAVQLLDQGLRPVPPGEIGELFIAGDGVARGYVDRPEATAERFVDLISPEGRPVRHYKTGDFCRCRPDGSFEFIGRHDGQVKIRGFRVELGEIESVLLCHPAVDQAVVVTSEDAPGERRLVGYVVPRATLGKKVSEMMAAGSSIVSQLRLFLKGRLPDYMVPGPLMLVERFELGPNGKVQRESLPEPSRIKASGTEFRGPRTSTEALVCEIWASLLDLAHVDVDDDFFELGGDSLMGVEMFVEIEKRTGHKLPAGFIQQMRSVARIAACLDKKGKCCRPPVDSLLYGIQPRGTRAPLYLVHGVGGGMLWGYENLARYLGADQPVFAFKACSAARRDECDTVRKMAALYVRELRRFQPEGPYVLGGYCFGGNVAHEMACLLEQEGQSVSLLAMIGSSPRNSSYDRVKWNARHFIRFLRNLGHWALGFMHWKYEKQSRFVRWKANVLRQKIEQRFFRRRAAAARDVDRLIDLSAIPASQQDLWVLHVTALDRHKANVYSGKMLLLRSQCHRINCSYDRNCGWSEYALGGVDTRVTPGFHDGLLDEPAVGVVADELKLRLDGLSADERPRC
jgi:amino acid adenylation domain-containing protein